MLEQKKVNHNVNTLDYKETSLENKGGSLKILIVTVTKRFIMRLHRSSTTKNN